MEIFTHGSIDRMGAMHHSQRGHNKVHIVEVLFSATL